MWESISESSLVSCYLMICRGHIHRPLSWEYNTPETHRLDFLGLVVEYALYNKIQTQLLKILQYHSMIRAKKNEYS